jgi:hypothetical protein
MPGQRAQMERLCIWLSGGQHGSGGGDSPWMHELRGEGDGQSWCCLLCGGSLWSGFGDLELLVAILPSRCFGDPHVAWMRCRDKSQCYGAGGGNAYRCCTPHEDIIVGLLSMPRFQVKTQVRPVDSAAVAVVSLPSRWCCHGA